MHENGLLSTQGQFEPVLLSKNDDEECSFLKYFDFNKNKENESHLGGLSALTEALLVEPAAEFGTKLGKA